jgi:tellurite resistance protein TehA-like permease
MTRIRTFHPAWGAVTMTLGGFALLSLLDPWPGSTVDDTIGAVVLGLTLLVAIATSVVFIVRVIAHREHFASDLANPAMGAMTAAWPASLLIAALAVLQAGIVGLMPAPVSLWVAGVLGVPGLVGTLIAGVAFYTRVIGSSDVPVQAISGNWFVPVVPLVLVPSIAVRCEALGAPADGASLAFAATVAWGIGFGLFLLLAAIIGGRLITAVPPAPHAAPTWWLWLAPIGAGGLGAISISRMNAVAATWPDVTHAATLFSTLLWGFGVWWLVFASIVVFRQRRELQFGITFWGFGFPSAALIALTVELAKQWQSTLLSLGATATWLAALVGLVALTGYTLAHVRGGRIFSR